MLDKILDWFKTFFTPPCRCDEEGRDYELVDAIEVLQLKGKLVSPHPVHLKEHMLLNLCAELQDSLSDLCAACGAQDLSVQAEVAVEMVFKLKCFAAAAGLPWEELWDLNVAWIKDVNGEGDARAPWWPDTEKVLAASGYNRKAFTNQEGDVVNNFCWDDRRLPAQDLLPSDVEL